MNRLMTFLLIAALGAANTFAADASMPSPEVTAAMRQAAESQKYVLIEFFSYNSVESKMLKDNVLANPQVVPALAEKVILVAVEHEKNKELAQRYGISRVPALVLINAEGKEIDRLLGYRSPGDLMRLLQGRTGDRSSMVDLEAKAAASDAGVEAHLSLADAYRKAGKADQAVGELTLCLDRVVAPGADRRYLKVVTSRITEIGRGNPAVLELLKSRRDRLEKEPISKIGDVQVLFALNESLKEPERNVDHYLKIAPDSPLRRQFLPAVFRQLVEQRRYVDATTGLDLETYINNSYPTPCVGHDHAAHGHDEAGHARMEKVAQERLVDLAAAAVEALLATDRLEKAKRIAGRLLETYDGKATRLKLTGAAQRSSAKAAGDFTKWIETTYPALEESP